jgi:hypothetical protein
VLRDRGSARRAPEVLTHGRRCGAAPTRCADSRRVPNGRGRYPRCAELGPRHDLRWDYGGRTNAWPSQPAGVPILPLLSHAELRVLAAAGFEIGAHGATHARLDRLSVAAAEQEIAGAKRRLEEGLGQAVTAFAYPYGRADAYVRRCAAAHYRAACSDELRTASSDDDRHWLGRLDMYYFRGGLPLRLLGTPWGDGYVGLRRLGRRTRAAASGLGRALRLGQP